MPGKKEEQLIAFTLYPGVTPLDLIGPLSVLRDIKLRTPYRTVVVGERVEPMVSDTPVALVPARAFHEVPRPFALFVPGGSAAVEVTEDDSLLAYVRSAAETAQIVGATGNGALVLAAAGLLEGRQVAVHWAYRQRLENLGARYAEDRWVEDGKFLTSSGGSAGIDMTLYLVSKLKSASLAKLTQIFVEYDPQPPFGRINVSSVDHHVTKVLGMRASGGSVGKKER